MRISTLAIPLAFIMLSVLLLWCLIGSKGKWWVKMILIFAVPNFALVVWKTLDTYLGWPTPEELPDEFAVVWVEIREPNPKIGDEGAIYIWVRPHKLESGKENDILGYSYSPNEPRAYKLPYFRGLHEQMEKARRTIIKGRPVFGKRKGSESGSPGDGKRDGDGPNNPGNREGRDGDGNRQDGSGFEFYELPPGQYPDKNKKNGGGP